MESLEMADFESKLMASVFTGDVEKLGDSQMNETQNKNEVHFNRILMNSIEMQAAARKESSSIFITF